MKCLGVLGKLTSDVESSNGRVMFFLKNKIRILSTPDVSWHQKVINSVELCSTDSLMYLNTSNFELIFY